MKDRAAKAAYDRARRAKRVDGRPTTCRGCGVSIKQARTSLRLYCANVCKGRAFYEAHPGYRAWVPVVPVAPIPMAYVGHPVFAQAAKVARLTGTSFSVDWGQNDIMGEAVLAIIEGRDPDGAVRKHRVNEQRIERVRSRVHDVGWDGRSLIVQRYGPSYEKAA